MPLSIAEACAVLLQCEAYSVAGSHRGSQEELEGSSPCSFASLPRPASLTDPTLGLRLPSQNAMQAQIAELPLQNTHVQGQLEQRQVSPAGSHASREQTSGRSSPASLLTQRIPPPSGHQMQVQQVQTSEHENSFVE